MGVVVVVVVESVVGACVVVVGFVAALDVTFSPPLMLEVSLGIVLLADSTQHRILGDGHCTSSSTS